MTIRVALYNSLTSHYEMFGHVIEYCITRGYKPVLYTNNVFQLGWLDFYKKQYDNKIEIYDHHQKIEGDVIFLLTDDDPVFPENNLDQNKIICIDHYYKIRRHTNIKRIDIRCFDRTINDKWVLPVYTLIPQEMKKHMVDKSNGIHVACIGYGGLFNLELMKKKIINFNDITFHIIKRYSVDMNINENNNIVGHVEESTSGMIDILGYCQYMMFIPIHKDYYDEKMSASVPLAFSTGCQIITDNQIKSKYDISSCMTLDINDSTPIEIKSVVQNTYNSVYNELSSLIERRDKWYDFFIQTILSK